MNASVPRQKDAPRKATLPMRLHIPYGTCPTGATGATGSVPLNTLTTYTTPTSPATTGEALDFDRNATVNGTAISHIAGASTVTLAQTGTYYAQYAGTAAPASGSSYPVTNTLQFALNGTPVTGAAVQHVFPAAGQTETQSMAVIFNVTSAPATLSVVSSGGNFNYSNYNLNVSKIG